LSTDGEISLALIKQNNEWKLFHRPHQDRGDENWSIKYNYVVGDASLNTNSG